MQKNKIKISYAITVKNEIYEFKNLLNILKKYKDNNDEIVIVQDISEKCDEISDFINNNSNIIDNYSEFYFKDNFSELKNFLISKCNKNSDYIFNLDADEIPNIFLIKNIKEIIATRKDIDIFFVPRINIVKDFTINDVEKYNWTIGYINGLIGYSKKNDIDYDMLNALNLILAEIENDIYYLYPIINWPDYQARIWKNIENIKWQGKVHETLTGSNNIAYLMPDIYYSILHLKNIERQRKQNAFYNEIGK